MTHIHKNVCTISLNNMRELFDYLKDGNFNISPEVLIIKKCNNVHPKDIKGANLSKLENVKYLYLYNCEKNFVYYWCDKYLFKSLEELYLIDSHPCEPNLFYRQIENIYISENYSHYKDRWANDNDHVQVLTQEQFILISEFVENTTNLVIEDNELILCI